MEEEQPELAFTKNTQFLLGHDRHNWVVSALQPL
jgi:hypothetical protein